MKLGSILLGLAAVVAGSPAFASSSVPKADLTVNITAPAGIYVGQAGQYRVDVANSGNKRADGVILTINLPRTHTSPGVSVLGTLGAYDVRCARSGTSLVCPLNPVNAGSSTAVRFTIALPQSSAPIVVDASATTSTIERTTTNNVDSDTAFLLHRSQVVSEGQSAHNEHCTGTTLTSFFECTLYPSSIMSHDILFQAGGQVAFVAAPATYHGTWTQPAADRLLLEYFNGTALQAHFDGYSVGNGCFDGMTTFSPASAYVSAYHVCVH